jgi:hypothetical protein
MASIQPLGTGVPPVISESIPESPLVGSNNFGAGVTGTSAGFAGVPGTSIVPPASLAIADYARAFRQFVARHRDVPNLRVRDYPPRLRQTVEPIRTMPSTLKLPDDSAAISGSSRC